MNNLKIKVLAYLHKHVLREVRADPGQLSILPDVRKCVLKTNPHTPSFDQELRLRVEEDTGIVVSFLPLEIIWGEWYDHDTAHIKQTGKLYLYPVDLRYTIHPSHF